MKNLSCLVLGYLFFCCGSNLKKGGEYITKNYISDSSKYNFKVTNCSCCEDLLVKKILKSGMKSMLLIEIKPEILYDSDDTDEFSFTGYQFTYQGKKIEFIDTCYYQKKSCETERAKIYLDKERLHICTINNRFVVDSMEMHIDYTDSEIYVFPGNPSNLLIVSRPMRWVGLMTRNAFFQLINIYERTVIEFICEDE